MSEDQKNFAIKTTQKGFSMYKDHFECAKCVKEQFENMVVLVLVIIMLKIVFTKGEFHVTIFKYFIYLKYI